MEKSYVIKARKLLRTMIHTIENAYSDDENNQVALGKKEEPYHIIIEFDNSLAVNERSDMIFWNDEDEFVLVVTNGKNSAVNDTFMLGNNGTIKNPYMIFLVDYSEIQQFRMVLDDNGYDQLMDSVIANGNFVGIRGKDEVPVDQQIVDIVKKAIHKRVDPINNTYVTNYSK